jgi:hypothetical protein
MSPHTPRRMRCRRLCLLTRPITCAALYVAVLSDQSVEADARKARARGLVVMGRVFQAYGSADALKSTDFAQHMQQVGARMAEKVAEEHDKQATA